MLRGLIFDLDGVLFDSIGVMEQAYAYACAEIGIAAPPPFTEYLKHLGRGFPAIMNAMALPQTLYEPYVRRSAELQDSVQAFEGVVEMLGDVAAMGLYIGAATGKSHQRATEILRRLDLEKHFDLVLGFDDVAAGKPNPEMIIRHIDKSGLRPYEMVVVGDAPSDMWAGYSARTFTAAALWGCRTVTEVLSCLPDFVLHEPHDVLGMLDPTRDLIAI